MRLLRYMACVLALSWAGTAMAGGGNVYLAQAKVYYQGLEFEKCLQRLDQAAKQPGNSVRQQAEVELYSGLCRFNLGAREKAEADFEQAVKIDPAIALPPATSPRITEVFDTIKAKVAPARVEEPASMMTAQSDVDSESVAPAKPIDAPRELSLEPQNAPPSSTRNELLATPEKSPSRVVPYALGGTAVVAAAVATYFGVTAKGHESQANDPSTYYAQAQTVGAQAKNEATVSNVLFGIAGAAAVGAVVTWFTAQ